MLGQPMSMLIPQVIGFKLTGSLPEGATATDLVLTVTELLRKKGVVGKFVEFYGPGVSALPLADRATIGNMSPEFGSTCAIFPIDAETLRYLKFSGPPGGARRPRRGLRQGAGHVARRGQRGADVLRHGHAGPRRRRPVAGRAQAPAGPRLARRRPRRASARRWPTSSATTPSPSPTATTRPRPRASRPPTRPPTGRPATTRRPRGRARAGRSPPGPRSPSARSTAVDVTLDGESFKLDHGHVVIAAITSCTNTSNPSVMLGAGLVARNAVARGLQRQPWVKTSLAPGLEGRHRVPQALGPRRVARRAGLQPRRLRLHDVHRELRPAARGGQRGGRRGRPRRRLGAQRQPQLRGAHQPRREDELPRVAAAGRRLRAGGHDGHRPRQRPARARRRGQRGLPQGPVADREGGRADRRGGRAVATCSAPATARSSTATSAGTASTCPRATASPGPRTRPTCASRRTSRTSRPSRRTSPTSRARGCSRSSATASRPTTSRPRARSRRTARPAPTSRSTASRSASSTPTARGAATTR